MPVSARQAVQHYNARQERARQLLSRLDALDTRVLEALDTVEEELAAALGALAQAFLPALEPAAIAQAERLTGFRGFSRRDPLRAMAREADVLRKTIARIEADPRYQRREYLVGPVGELTRARQEAASLLEPWEQECARFESQEGFEELVAVGYDTPRFTGRFWEASYWRHWATGDRICEALGMADFGDEVLPAWEKVALERKRWREELARADARIDEVHDLVREHDEAVARIPALPEVVLDGCHKVLAEHLGHADAALLDSWLQAEPDEQRPARLALRSVAGLLAKRAYLVELRDQGLSDMATELRRRAEKYARKSTKFGRPKYASVPIGDDQLDPAFLDKADKLERALYQQGLLVERVLGYDAYDRFDLANDPELWFMEMTGKRPSRLTPSLRSWYDRSPSVVLRHVDEVEPAAVALAAADRELDQLDFVS